MISMRETNNQIAFLFCFTWCCCLYMHDMVSRVLQHVHVAVKTHNANERQNIFHWEATNYRIFVDMLVFSKQIVPLYSVCFTLHCSRSTIGSNLGHRLWHTRTRGVAWESDFLIVWMNIRLVVRGKVVYKSRCKKLNGFTPGVDHWLTIDDEKPYLHIRPFSNISRL